MYLCTNALEMDVIITYLFISFKFSLFFISSLQLYTIPVEYPIASVGILSDIWFFI